MAQNDNIKKSFKNLKDIYFYLCICKMFLKYFGLGRTLENFKRIYPFRSHFKIRVKSNVL